MAGSTRSGPLQGGQGGLAHKKMAIRKMGGRKEAGADLELLIFKPLAAGAATEKTPTKHTKTSKKVQIHVHVSLYCALSGVQRSSEQHMYTYICTRTAIQLNYSVSLDC